MGERTASPSPPARVEIVGLGPGDLERVPPSTVELLADPARRVIVRTLEHPAAEQVAALRPVESCDDLYQAFDRFDDVYAAIAERVLAVEEPVVYAVPGSPLVGELAVGAIRRLAAERGREVVVHPGESFLDVALAELGVDPLRDGFQVLNGHDLPDPLVIDKPTLIGHLDVPEVLADVSARLDRVLAEGTGVTVLVGLGSAGASVVTTPPSRVRSELAGVRTSMYVPPQPGGLIGAVHAMRRLRQECPWDREQTHHSLIRYLVEEVYELADALAALPEGNDPDWGAYAEVEEELGDVLLQVLFHATIARQVGAFDIDDVAEQLRQKLVRRHPHVFGDLEVEDAVEVKRNWEAIKADEKQPGESLLDGIPTGLPGLSRAAEVQRRAAKVGFDWPDAAGVVAKLQEELGELTEVIDDPTRRGGEVGDLLFTIVNLARHLDVEPEAAIRSAVHRFERRLRSMEDEGPLGGLSIDQLDERWERAKELGQDP